jgi:hypothetical protein
MGNVANRIMFNLLEANKAVNAAENEGAGLSAATESRQTARELS